MATSDADNGPRYAFSFFEDMGGYCEKSALIGPQGNTCLVDLFLRLVYAGIGKAKPQGLPERVSLLAWTYKYTINELVGLKSDQSLVGVVFELHFKDSLG